MVLCVSCEAGLSSKAQKCGVHWVGTDWMCAASKCFATAQSLHADIPLMHTYQVFNGHSQALLCISISPGALNTKIERVLPFV